MGRGLCAGFPVRVERQDYEALLSGCARCREAIDELSGMPALLAMLDPEQVAALDEGVPDLAQVSAYLASATTNIK